MPRDWCAPYGPPYTLMPGQRVTATDAMGQPRTGTALTVVHVGQAFPHIHLDLGYGESVWPANDVTATPEPQETTP